MGKIIGRGVLLLKKSNGHKLYFGYELSSEGIRLYPLGGDALRKTLNEALPPSQAAASGTGHLILNALPASPNDAFYGVTFNANSIGTGSESFTLQVEESGPFAHGPQSHFSNLDLTFTYNSAGLSVGGTVTAHLYEGVFENEETIQLAPKWNKESETLIFSSDTAEIQMDSIGKLSKIKVEVGSAYDRWAQVQGLYTFEEPGNTAGEFMAHDISGQNAPTLFSDGTMATVPSGQEAAWPSKGIAFEGGFLASQEGVLNPVIDSLLETEAFSVELWIKPTKAGLKIPGWIFAFQNRRDEPTKKNPYNFFLGQEADAPGAHVKAKFDFPELGVPDLNGRRWETPLKSPGNSLKDELMHVVYSCDQDGMQRIFIDGVQVAQRSDPGYDNKWEGGLRIVVGSDLPRGLGNINPGTPWNGEMHQLAIFNRALTPEEVNLHYRPAIKITGDFSLDNVIDPLLGEVFPFHLSIGEAAASLTAAKAVDYEIKPVLGFRQVYLECTKSLDSDWSFSGKFQTRFWNDLVDLNADLALSDKQIEAAETGPKRLHLRSPSSQPELIHTSKYSAILLRIGDQNAWELSFGARQEIAVIPFALENAMLSYQEFKMGGPHLVLADPITLEGFWLNEDMDFTSVGTGEDRKLTGSTEFTLPFSVELPQKIDPETGNAWGDPIRIELPPNPEPVTDGTLEGANAPENLKLKGIKITLDVELRKDGFLGVVNASFYYREKQIIIPERRIYKPPVSKMALLGDILEDLKRQTDTLFAGLRKHAQDYYLEINGGQPNIHFKALASATDSINSILPDLSDVVATFPIPTTNDIQIIKNDQGNCCLKIKVGMNKAQAETAYQAFFEEPKIKGLPDATISLLRRRIVERLPLDYGQALEYYYGWNVDEGYIDLHSGMRLRVDFQNYQFVHVTEQNANSGFVGGGSIHIPINTYTYGGAQKLGFGPFLSNVKSEGQEEIHETGAGGLIDVLRAGNRKAFYRLFYPKQPATGPGSERVVTFLGADTFAALEKGTQEMIQNGNSTASGTVSFFFRGKAMIIPEIQVYVSDQAAYVPVGTTLRQLIERYDDIPGAGLHKDLRAFTGKARPRRRIHEGVNSQPEYRFINFPENDPLSNIEALIDLPLIKGDRFYF